MPEQTPIIHALLIGIDYYKPNRLYRSLRGAVRDINLVDTFLRETLKIPSARIRRLISSNPEDPTLSAVRSAGEQDPTYENIVRTFDEINQAAQPGEQVYIHYSGHGGRVITIYPNLKQGNREQYDEGLVPMDIGDTPDGRYLRDVEMTTLLKRMTDKGLIVTLVLDCCNSGDATRGDAEIRGGTEPDLLARSTESLVADRKELERNWLDLTRHRTVSVAGLPQARDYVLLAACRPNESAYEYAVNGGTERYGALTYWMIDTLTSMATRSEPLTYKLLHDRVNAQIQSKFPQQLPMIVGESDRKVFGSDRWSTPYTVSVIKVDVAQVTLNAGQAQGLSQGTRFSIYPLNTTEFSDKQRQAAIVELTRADASESIARIVSLEEGGIEINGKLESGAPAIMVSAPVDLIRRVRFFQKPEGNQEHELPSSFVYQQTQALEAVRQALTRNGWIVEVKEGESAHYQVAVGRDGEYEISIGSPLRNLRPALLVTDATAPKRVVDRLVHLAKYQAVQSLDNASSRLAQAIDFQVLKQDGTAFDDPQNPVIKNGEIVRLQLINAGSQPLKVAVLDIEPTWAISQIPIAGLESPFFQLEAGAKEEIPLQMNIPNDEAYQQCKETLKVFAIGRGLADFRWLTLPSLDEPPAPRGAEFAQALKDVMEQSATRGEAEGINPLNELLAAIGADFDQAPNVTRAATMILDPKQEWVTKQIQIVVER